MDPKIILYASLEVETDESPQKVWHKITVQQEFDEEENRIEIGDRSYVVFVIDGFDDNSQITDKENNIIAYTELTTQHGDTITQEEIKEAMEELEKWVIEMSDKFNCQWEIKLTANYT